MTKQLLVGSSVSGRHVSFRVPEGFVTETAGEIKHIAKRIQAE